MKINNIDSKTNFNGIKLQTIKTPLKKIDIYSLDSRDENFIKNFIESAQYASLPSDTVQIGDKLPKFIIIDALKKAYKTSKNDYTSKVLISVENDKKITGIINAEFEGDMTVKGMASWSKGAARQGLLNTILRETQKLKDSSLIIPTEQMTEAMKRFAKKLGFVRPKDCTKIYTVDAPDMPQVLKHIESLPNYKVKTYKSSKFTDLQKKLTDIG